MNWSIMFTGRGLAFLSSTAPLIPNQPILQAIPARGILYVAKPFTSVQLGNKIREVLENSRAPSVR